MTAIPTLNANQFEPQNVVGQLDLQIARGSGVVSGKISPNAGAAIVAGSSVKLDTANTGSELWFLVAAASDVAFGRLVFTERASSPTAGQECEVACNIGPVVWCIADNTILPGALVQDGASGAEFVDNLTTGKQRGIALNYATAGQLIRVATKEAVS